MRWHHPTRGLLGPGVFINLAEQTGLIVPLTRWALSVATNQLAIWRRHSPEPLEVSVNLSLVNLKDYEILGDVAAARESSEIPPEELVLEINESTVIADHDVSPVVIALQKQVSNDFRPVWGTDAELNIVSKAAQTPTGHWWLVLLDDSDQANPLGYHDPTSEGLPMGKVFAASDLKAGTSWTVTASHELLEMLGDPDIDLTVFVQKANTAGILYAYEVCDACEDDSLGYTIDNVLLSDFVYPAWFESFRTEGSTQFDRMHKIQKPFQLLAGA